MTGVKSYNSTAASNTEHFAENQRPPTVNDGMRQVQADLAGWYFDDAGWREYGDGNGSGDGTTDYTASFVDADTFTIDGADVTAVYHEGRRVRWTVDGGSYKHGVITSSSFSTNTTVNLAAGSDTITSGTLRVWIGLPFIKPSVPVERNLSPRTAITDTSGTDVAFDPSGRPNFFEVTETLAADLSIQPASSGQEDGEHAIVARTGTNGAFTFKITGLVYPVSGELEVETGETVLLIYAASIGWYALEFASTSSTAINYTHEEVEVTGNLSITSAHRHLSSSGSTITRRVLRVRRSSDVAITLTFPDNPTSDDWIDWLVEIDDTHASAVTLSRNSSGDMNGATSLDMAPGKGSKAWVTLRKQDTGPDTAHYSVEGDLAEDTTLYGNILGNGKTISNSVLQDTGETVNALGSQSGGITADYVDGQVVTVTLTGNATSLTISNPPASGTAGSITFIIDHGSGPYTWSHPSGITWGSGAAPTFSDGANEISIVTYVTTDGGTTWRGFFGGEDFS